MVQLGVVLATPGALEAAKAAGVGLGAYVIRHANGDWGDVCSEDRQANEAALQDGSRLLSAYRLRCCCRRNIDKVAGPPTGRNN